MNAIVTKQANQALSAPEQPPIPVSESAAIFQIIERAARDPNVDIDKMQRLWEMRAAEVARLAEKAFNAAMKAAQAEMRPIAADATNSQTRSKYATYAALDRALRPIYTSHGFSLSFDEADSPKPDHIRCLCYVAHDEGHTRTYRKDMPADGKGAKGGDVMTKTHATGAAASYGSRYLLKGIFNVAVGEDDDDGNHGGAVDNGERPAPPSRSSASLKRRDENGKDAWDRLIEALRSDLADCKSSITLSKLRADYREKARNERWPRAWLDALADEFDGFEDKLPKVDDGDFPGDLPSGSFVHDFVQGR